MNVAIILGYLVFVIGGGFVAAYAWYRLVTWPRRRRHAQEYGFAVVQGKNVLWDEVRNLRPASFVGWLTGRETRA